MCRTAKPEPSLSRSLINLSGKFLLVIGVMLATLPSSSSVAADEDTRVRDDKSPSVKILDKQKVYFPTKIKKGKKYKKPAVVVTSTVYDSIDEWKKIKERKLTEKDAEYHLLLTKASGKFHKAIKKVAKDGSYDIIAEKTGAIECKNVTADDVTQKAIDALP